MCGICGFTNPRDNSIEIIKDMADAIKHRGPDGEGYLVGDDVVFGHRRLALIDLDCGAQPMSRDGGKKVETTLPTDPDHVMASPRRYSIVFNGEIYNYADIKIELERDGWEFSTGSDTEVLLVGYIAWKEKVLDRLRGMFAFVIWDDVEKELFCARDFFGIKPFYYAEFTDETFVFASEAKAILEHPSYEKAVNEKALISYLAFQFPATQETFFKGVFKLPAGHFMTVKNGETRTERYWQMEYELNEHASFDDRVERIRRVMSDSVRYHNVADVEVGSFLSSGIDSSYLAALLAKENPDIKTFTVGFSEYSGERDEVSWAAELAGRLGVGNDGKHISEGEFWDAVPEVVWHMDEPLGDPAAFALYFVDEIASNKVKAVLSGEGADELFGGYKIYNAPLASDKVSWLPKKPLKHMAGFMQKHGIRGGNYLERASEDPRDWYYTNANGAAFAPNEISSVLNERMAELAVECPSPADVVAQSYDDVKALDDISQMQYVDIMHWLEGDILLKTDKMSMAHSLESRVPFLDREVAGTAGSLTRDQKVDGSRTKIALRAASENTIPQDWAKKEKLGFPVPLAGWLRKQEHIDVVRRAFHSKTAREYFNIGELDRMLDEHISGADKSRRIWIVYVFIVWHDVFFGKI